MCLAIYKPAATQPDKEAYRYGFESNDHGAGFAAVVNGKLVVEKGFFKFKKFWKAFEPYAECAALVHFRFATHGKRDEANCHPFMVADDLAMIHNGVLPICTKSDKDKSDTWHYVESVLKPLYELTPEFYRHDAIAYLGSAAISGSKFAFLRDDGDFAIWNEEAGVWTQDGHWYSNNSFEAPRITRYSSSRYDDDDDLIFGGRIGPRGLDWSDKRDESNPRALVEREMFPDYDPDALPVGAWGPDVPADMEWIADEMIRFGYDKRTIERGFADDPMEMHDLLMEHYEDVQDEAEARAYGLQFNGEE